MTAEDKELLIGLAWVLSVSAGIFVGGFIADCSSDHVRNNCEQTRADIWVCRQTPTTDTRGLAVSIESCRCEHLQADGGTP